VTVAWKLALPEPVRFSCVAEELASYAIVQEAAVWLEEHDAREEAADLEHDLVAYPSSPDHPAEP
jgi:hypothetical protein